MSSSIMIETASTLAKKVEELSRLLAEYSLNEPSLELNGSPDVWTTLDPTVAGMRHQVIDLASQVTRLVGGPPLNNFYIINTYATITALVTTIDFGIITRIPLDGEATLDELEAHAGFSKDKLGRILRALASTHIFEEVRPEVFRHTQTSYHLAKDPPLCALYQLAYHDGLGSCQSFSEYLRAFPYSEKTYESNYKFKNGLEFWEAMTADPVKAKRFPLAMQGIASFPERDTALLKEYLELKVKGEGKRTIVKDVGGNKGHVSIALAQDFPELTFVVQDKYDEFLSERQRDLPEALQLRVKFENQDFFLPQSLADADNIKTLFIRQCLHNWANEDVVKILGSFSELLKTSDEISLLINDTVIPVHGEVFPHEEFYTLQFDLIMMLYMNARQRSLAEWTSLAKQANPHYEVVAFTQHLWKGPAGLVEIKYKA